MQYIRYIHIKIDGMRLHYYTGSNTYMLWSNFTLIFLLSHLLCAVQDQYLLSFVSSSMASSESSSSAAPRLTKTLLVAVSTGRSGSFAEK